MFQETKSRLKQATGCLSPPLLQVLMPHISELENKVQEIRLRVNRPVTVIGTGGSPVEQDHEPDQWHKGRSVP